MTTDNTTLARYYYVSAVREGLAAYLTNTTVETRAILNASLTPRIDGQDRTEKVQDLEVALYGPGDVLGLDPRVVSLTDPRKNVWDHEAEMLVQAVLREPDLPWRFSPCAADSQHRLTPWITL